MARSLSVSQGKGITQELAVVSGIMESIEVFHAEQKRPPSILRNLFEYKRDGSFICPKRMAMRSDADLDARKIIPWVRGTDLIDDSEKWIPEELFNLDFTKHEPAPVFLTSSNGLASGNTRAEAVVHGICEVVERDQVSFWSVEQEYADSTLNRRVVIESVKDPVCEALIHGCLAAGLEIFIWYCTTTIDIPVFKCTIVDRRNKSLYPHLSAGFGCHLIATIALARAITEAAQSRLTHISGLREDLTWSRYRQEFLCEANNNRLELARMSEQRATIDFGTLCSCSVNTGFDMQNLLDEILNRLGRAGLQNVIVVDLAENEIFSVVFVCVPELEYRTSKAGTLYTPGLRMSSWLERNSRAITSEL